jgi:hypothetical protein
MKTIFYADSRRMISRERVFIPSLKSESLRRRFKRYIETSDWDERIVRKQPVIDMICWGVVLLSGLAFAPFVIQILLP